MHLEPGTLVALGIAGAVAGCLGAIVGIGGGILLVPALVVGFGFDMRIAVATSLVAVVATSTAAGSVYVGSGMTNTRLAMSLEVATTLGGLGGGLLATRVSARALAGLFAAMTAVTMVLMLRKYAEEPAHAKEAGDLPASEGWEERGRLAGGYHDAYAGGVVRYEATRLGLAHAGRPGWPFPTPEGEAGRSRRDTRRCGQVRRTWSRTVRGSPRRPRRRRPRRACERCPSCSARPRFRDGIRGRVIPRP